MNLERLNGIIHSLFEDYLAQKLVWKSASKSSMDISTRFPTKQALRIRKLIGRPFIPIVGFLLDHLAINYCRRLKPEQYRESSIARNIMIHNGQASAYIRTR
jgi:hypothetical protein